MDQAAVELLTLGHEIRKPAELSPGSAVRKRVVVEGKIGALEIQFWLKVFQHFHQGFPSKTLEQLGGLSEFHNSSEQH